MRTGELILCFLSFVPYLTYTPVESLYYSILALALFYHLYTERCRWQLTPLYMLLLLNIAVGIESGWMTFLAFCFLVSAVVLGIALPVPQLPAPVHFSVGIIEAEWDYEFPQPLTKVRVTPERRKLSAKILYPVDVSTKPTGKGPAWLPRELSAKVLEIGVSPKIPSFILSHLSLVELPCIPNAPISKHQRTWPLIMFSHGLKGIPQVYMTLAIELASQGFIVCMPLHTDGMIEIFRKLTREGSSSLSYDNFAIDDHSARNEQVKIRAHNISFLLDRLLSTNGESQLKVIQDKICPENVSAIGHSFGGATAVKAAKDDPRIKCCIGLDPWLFPLDEEDKTSKTNSPILFLGSHKWQWEENINRMWKVLSSTSAENKMVLVKGMDHQNFCDVPFLASPFLLRKGKVIGYMERNEGLQMMSSYIIPFLVKNSPNLTRESFFNNQAARASNYIKKQTKNIVEMKQK